MESKEIGTVVRLHARKCVVVSDADGREIACHLRGRLFENASVDTKPVAVGDRVRVMITSRGAALEQIFPRRNELNRPAAGRQRERQTIAANIDRMIVVSAVRDPELKTGLIDRFLVAAAAEGFDSVICINKLDLAEEGEVEEVRKRYERLGYAVFLTSAVDGRGIDALARELGQGITLIMGQSGVGKSTILNRIDPSLALKTGSISTKQKKGRHTTTSVSLLLLSGGGFVVDTPGIREFGVSDIKPSDLSHYFPEMAERLADCQYNDCTHRHEPDCAVLKALESGEISRDRYESYLRMLKDLV
jgi:ribosome biogenesis GTPase